MLKTKKLYVPKMHKMFTSKTIYKKVLLVFKTS